jgi:[acyl-carrier-protein] S-malonyltransferase
MTIDANRSAFLFPGQGSQKIGMGNELAAALPAAKNVFEQADQQLGFALSAVAWEGPEEELNDTINTQPALLVHSVAALRVFQNNYPDFKPAFVAGHSLGELSALVAAGSLEYADALSLVRRRGELMKQAGEQNPGGMAAILGLDIPSVEAATAEASSASEVVQVANDNCPGQVVISGHSAAVERAMMAAKEAGAKRALPLAVSIAAHSPLMLSAQAEFSQAVSEAPIVDPNVPIVGNVSAKALNNATEIRADLEAQLSARVRWTQTIQYMLDAGVTTFIELGSGSVLVNLLKRIDRDAERITLSSAEDFEKLGQRA